MKHFFKILVCLENSFLERIKAIILTQFFFQITINYSNLNKWICSTTLEKKIVKRKHSSKIVLHKKAKFQTEQIRNRCKLNIWLTSLRYRVGNLKNFPTHLAHPLQKKCFSPKFKSTFLTLAHYSALLTLYKMF